MDMYIKRLFVPAAAFMLLTGSAAGALAQGAIKPLEAIVVNPPSRPVPVAPVAAKLEPVQTRCISSASQGGHGCELYVVPAGKRLVIDSVSHYISTATTGVQVHWVVVGSTASTDELLPMTAGSSTFSAPLTSTGTNIHYYIGTHPARIVVDEGLRVVAWVHMSPSAFNTFSVSINGHLVDR